MIFQQSIQRGVDAEIVSLFPNFREVPPAVSVKPDLQITASRLAEVNVEAVFDRGACLVY